MRREKQCKPNQNSYQTPTAVNEVTLQQQQVLRNTYLLLALSLIPTGIGALIGVNLNFGFMREPDRFVARVARRHLRHVLCDREEPR